MSGAPVESVKRACRLLGWAGQVVGPVQFGGIRFWASVQLDDQEHNRRQAHGAGAATAVEEGELGLSLSERVSVTMRTSGRARPPLQLYGCLVVSSTPRAALRDASFLAGYAARAILVPDRGDVLGLLADAALLDQGVALQGPQGVTVLALAGQRVAGGEFNDREWELLESAYESYLDQVLTPTHSAAGARSVASLIPIR